MNMAKLFAIVGLISSSLFLSTCSGYCNSCTGGHVLSSEVATSGGSISSQYRLPDGSLVTNSKGNILTSDGIQSTFHQLKKEADKFVQTGSSGTHFSSSSNAFGDFTTNQHGFSGAGNGYQTSGQINFPSSSYNKGGISSFSSGGGSSSSYSQQSQSAGGSSGTVFQTIPSNIVSSSSYSSKEQEVKKEVMSGSHGSSIYQGVPTPDNILNEKYQSGLSFGSNTETLPSSNIHYIQTGSGYSDKYQDTSSSGGYNSQKVVSSVVPTGHSHSYQSSYSSSSSIKNSSGGTPVNYYSSGGSGQDSSITGYSSQYVVGNHNPSSHSQSTSNSDYSSSIVDQLLSQPGTFNRHPSQGSFTSGVINLSQNMENREGQGLNSISRGVPTSVVVTETAMDGGNLYSTGQNQIVFGHKFNQDHQKYEHGKESAAYEDTGFPKPSYVKVISENSSSFAHEAQSHSQLPTAHVSQVVVNVEGPTSGSSQYEKHESSSSSHSSSGNKVYIPGYNQQISSGQGSLYVSGQQQAQYPTGSYYANTYGSEGSSSKVDDKKISSSSSQTFGADGFLSPILIRGEPQTIGGQSSSSKFESFGGGSTYGGGISVNTPVHVHEIIVPQAGGSKSSSSSSSSSYYSSSSSGGSGSLQGSSGSYYGENTFDKLKGASASIYDSSNAEALCNPCTGSSLSSSGTPVKTSYGVSTSFSSHSSNVNGKKTENREAAVSVNDNGKIDSYHVKT